MDKIVLADYIGHCDNNGKPMGHPIKVINENCRLLEPVFGVRIAVPRTHVYSIKEKEIEVIKLKYNICAFSTQKFLNFIKKWKNLNDIFKNQENDIIWFINVDFSLFLYLYLKKEKRVWINLCYNPLKNVSGWRRKVIRSVLENVEKVVLTNKNFLKEIPGNKIYIPDYYYNAELYDKFQKTKKKKQVVCLGTMGKEKELEKLVLAMKKSEIPLIICGNFKHDEGRYQNLQKLSEGRNLLENKFVTDDEYYDLIANSKYVVLPYDMKLYNERTSGILLEAVFLHSVPVAPRELLKYNGIEGIGYQKIEEIPLLLEDEKKELEIVKNNDELLESVFSVVSMREKLMSKRNENKEGRKSETA